MKVAGIYLAAGQSRRMGVSKLSLKLSQEDALGSIALRELDRCNLEPLIVVVRADDPLDWLPAVREDQGPQRLRRTETCLTAHLGLSFSLRCGLNALLPLQPDAVIVALADQPFVTAHLVNRLIEMYEQSPELDFVASVHEGSPMPPALFSKALFPVLQGLDGDKGAAGILRSPDYKGLVLEPEAEHWYMDADTEADFSGIQEQWNMQNH